MILVDWPNRPEGTRTMSEHSDTKAPWLVGLLRGGAGAAIIAVVGVLIADLGNVHAGTLAKYAPAALLAMRALEAWVLDQRKNAWPPSPGNVRPPYRERTGRD